MKRKKNLGLLFFVITTFVLSSILLGTQNIPTPEEFFGFRMGDDGRLARWDKIVEYFDILDKRSDRIEVRCLGKTTLGNPFILAIFSSPENLKNLEMYREMNKKIADPRGLSEKEVERLIQKARYVSVQTYSLHATEVGGTQCTPELAYELVTSDDPVIKMILENTIFLMFPCFNPDGEIMVTDWYYKYKGTKYDNTRLPYLYHFYTGHDNNRDAYQLTQKESQYFAKIVYRDWIPQSYVDHHHFGSSGARFYIPPYYDPIHPNVIPLIWREHQLYGSHMAIALESKGKSGFETGAPFTGWWQASFHMATNYHNIAGMLTESASCDWADPVYILPDQLSGTRGRPEYKPQMTMPRLWEGGWWRLRDIVEQQIIASKAVLELGARYRETLLRNMIRKAEENIQKGEREAPYAFIIPRNQHDFLTAVKLVKIFQMNGVEIHRLDRSYRMGWREFSEGSFVILCSQPMRSFIVSYLEQINYPDNYWTRSHVSGQPLRPYDLAGYSVSEHMGVEAIPINRPICNISLTRVVDDVKTPEGRIIGTGGNVYLLEHRFNDSFIALNRLLSAEDVDIYWTEEGFNYQDRYMPCGTMIIQGGSNLRQKIQELARRLGLSFYSIDEDLNVKKVKLKKPRLGVYRRYAGGSMDAGWTHWLLQEFEFPVSILHNKDIKDNRFVDRYDVVIIPSDSYRRIVIGDSSRKVPPEYRGGIGDGGIKNLRDFVKKGGTLICLNISYDFAQKVFNLPLRNAVSNVDSKEFFCPGSTLKISIDISHPIGYGMEPHGLALFRNSPVLDVWAGEFKDGVSIPVRYHEENILKSGWLIGEKYLSNRPAVVVFRVGGGKVILLGFPVQHRAQTHGTFKLLFNSIYYGAFEK